MKKIILINTHLCSGSEALYWSLSKNPFIQGCRNINIEKKYYTNLDLLTISSNKHKLDSKKSLYLDEVLFNHVLSTKIDYTKCIVINFIRSPKDTLESMLHFKRINPIFALRYYQYRLNRIYQISKVAKKCVFLKFESIEKEEINYLNNLTDLDLNIKKEYFEGFKKGFKKDTIPKELLEEGDKCYERYHYLLTKQISHKNLYC
jgi:hypothetical protein